MKLNKGSYLLLIKIKKPVEIKIGSLGRRRFEKGYYVYVGSAMNNLKKRVERHMNTSESKKGRDKKYWHIDYLLSNRDVFIENVYYKESEEKEECKIARDISKFSRVTEDKFGSSDCKCESHLFKTNKKEPEKNLEGFKKLKP